MFPKEEMLMVSLIRHEGLNKDLYNYQILNDSKLVQ